MRKDEREFLFHNRIQNSEERFRMEKRRVRRRYNIFEDDIIYVRRKAFSDGYTAKEYRCKVVSLTKWFVVLQYKNGIRESMYWGDFEKSIVYNY